ncbi:polysaccharide deacetylase family protein [Falsiroseomonas stagni]|uniref:Peptidoglycan/xylan/chitin deacetylase, PgdA/CDA1 family n=1 Tax=Falsiroseomonas stagni DSM 19981 TaxID=1123062 RepID=A0A1I3XDB6_9PROT|nr:polysaccharide deacetylase family protein [Falsiroseomonas stagni]SFK17533.1 Peptidoglycan/xylan/chitin deacetylase, PgdA/CDA1 family [Falsiroseomonas stagni DSM 19981]
MRDHGRYAYSAIAQRPAWDWPGGKRLAVFIAVNLEAFPFAEGMGIPLVNPLPEPDVQNYGFRDWGNRVGVWNLLDSLDEYALPAAALMNTAIYDLCPPVAEAFRARGDEVVGHGRTNAERQCDMDEATERAMIAACRARIAAEEGVAPRGWMGPWVAETHVTPDLLAEAGFDYVMDWTHDDQPTRLVTRGAGSLVTVPYSKPTNDIPILHAAKWPPADWADALIDQFEEQRRLSKKWPLTFNLSLHPFLVGHAFRLKHLRRVFAHIAAAQEEVWLCRPGDIARHAATVV